MGADDGDGEAMRSLRAAMSRHVGVVRDREGLSEALALIRALSARAAAPQLKNALTAARLVAAAALKREESRGGHFRSDFPEPDPLLAKRTYMLLADADAIAAGAAGRTRAAS